MLRTPLILVNFKTYEEASGKAALDLSRICEVVSLEMNASIAVAPPMMDLALVASSINILSSPSIWMRSPPAARLDV